MKTSAERVYVHIKDAILNGRFDGGTRLPEDMIASEIGVSRTPVRDALRRLQSEGLIEIAPNFGARVASWTEAELGEITQMRVMLEGFACTLAASKITANQLTLLSSYCDEMAEAAKGGANADLDQISRTNLGFHRVIAEAADNSRLTAAVEPLWHFPVVIRKFALFSPSRIERSVNHHYEILAALREGDAEWAGAVMRAHIHSARAFDAMLIIDP